MKIRYKPLKDLRRASRKIIDRSNTILDEYAAQGFILTLRQLYYQHVARGWLPNRQKEYKRLGKIVGDGRLCGLIDWEAIEDRTRNLKDLTHFGGPQDALQRLAGWYHTDLWANQSYRPEVWIEKDALAGVIEGVCQENDVPYFSCRGYTSLSEIWRAAERLKGHSERGQAPFIIHFGDHDPSGMDMSRDIVERIRDTFGAHLQFIRVALNMEQIEEFNPPPNPAKVTDSRYKAYLAEYGDESWELDALEPKIFRELVETQLAKLRNEKVWKKDLKAKEKVKAALGELSGRWEQLETDKATIKEQAARLAEMESARERWAAGEREATQRVAELEATLKRERAANRKKK